jgi:acyl carrier protein
MSVMTELQEFIADEITHGRAIGEIGPDDDLLAQGIIDSLGVTMLLEFVYERYGVNVGVDELVPANFQNLRAIEVFLERKRGVPC